MCIVTTYIDKIKLKLNCFNTYNFVKNCYLYSSYLIFLQYFHVKLLSDYSFLFTFLGAFNDESCRKIGCHYELLYTDKILKRCAPVFYEKADGCPIDWFYRE